jgi:hypothetical protein
MPGTVYYYPCNDPDGSRDKRQEDRHE